MSLHGLHFAALTDLATFLHAQERLYLVDMLKITKGRIQKTADLAGISRRTLLRKLIEHKINKRDPK